PGPCPSARRGSHRTAQRFAVRSCRRSAVSSTRSRWPPRLSPRPLAQLTHYSQGLQTPAGTFPVWVRQTLLPFHVLPVPPSPARSWNAPKRVSSHLPLSVLSPLNLAVFWKMLLLSACVPVEIPLPQLLFTVF